MRPRPAEVRGLARVLFEVGSLDADPGAVGQVEEALGVDRLVVLADLVVLGHVGIEVVLAVEARGPDLAVQGGADADGQLDRPCVEHRQRSGQPEADRADVGVRLAPNSLAQPQKSLVVVLQLGVDLEAHHHLPVPRAACSRCRSCLEDRGSAEEPLLAQARAEQLDADGEAVGPGAERAR